MNPVTVGSDDVCVVQSLNADVDDVQSEELVGRAKNKGNQSSCSMGGTYLLYLLDRCGDSEIQNIVFVLVSGAHSLSQDPDPKTSLDTYLMCL